MRKNIKSGNKIPKDINVIIEIAERNGPVKYEFDEETNMLIVDRFISTSLEYPCNYGFIPNSLSEDGDPIDVLVISNIPINLGAMINCRPVGMLEMEDESGKDNKIIAVPSDNLTEDYLHIKSIEDVPNSLLNKIKHFFEHYKDLDAKKWVKVKNFRNAEAAKTYIAKHILN